MVVCLGYGGHSIVADIMGPSLKWSAVCYINIIHAILAVNFWSDSYE